MPIVDTVMNVPGQAWNLAAACARELVEAVMALAKLLVALW